MPAGGVCGKRGHRLDRERTRSYRPGSQRDQRRHRRTAEHGRGYAVSGKKVTFGSRPRPKAEVAPDPEQWVAQRHADEKMKRMTFDVPESLHKRVKAGCALRGVTIRDVVLALLEQEFPAS